jgi:hypothetical protein
MELARVSSKYIDERRYQIPALGIPLESNRLSGFVESYSAIADEWGGGTYVWNVSSKVQMAQRNYENTELTYLTCSQQISNKFPTHNLELKKGNKIFISLVVSSK